MKKTSILIMLLLAMIMWPAKAVLTSNQVEGSAPVFAAAEDDEEEEPYIEPAFTVYFDIDDVDAVYFTVNDQPAQPVAADGLLSLTVDPGDGYIKVHVNDGYAFTKFTDTDVNGDYLQYDTQTMPVTIRKYLAVGAEERIAVDGHTFHVETANNSGEETYTLTVIVDNAAKTDMRIGSSIDANSSSNRRIALQDGSNSVVYTTADKYLHLFGPSFLEPLYCVTLDGVNVPDNGSFDRVFTIQLKGSQTNGSVIVVTAVKQVDDEPFSMNVVVDDIEMVKYFTQRSSSNQSDKEMLATMHSGENTLTFGEDNFFEIWVYGEPQECTFNGEALEFDSNYRRYQLYPTDGGTLVIRFNDLPRQFSIYVDDASQVNKFYNHDSVDNDELTLVDGWNTIDLGEKDGERFRLYTEGKKEAKCFKLDGEDVAFKNAGFYQFVPEVGSQVKCLFLSSGVETVIVEDADGVIYTLDGKKVTADPAGLPAGLYIVGGRKVIK